MAERRRVTKDPEERRYELLEAAEGLFLEKGFEKTMVSDIVKRVGVAQGTFYYYFRSKEEALAAILERGWRRLAAELLKNIDAEKMNALQKLQAVLGGLFRPETEVSMDSDGFRLLADTETARNFHAQFDEARVKALCPIIQGIVKEGIKEGYFRSLQCSDEVTEIIFFGINKYMHEYFPHFRNQAFFNRKMTALEELLERVLGIEEGGIKFTV